MTFNGYQGYATQRVPPFEKEQELIHDFDKTWLYIDQLEQTFLAAKLTCGILEELYPKLPLVAQKSGSHIDPLHEQALKQRTVAITEDPGLHLVWYYKTIYVKPIPTCLFNYGFWRAHLISANTQDHPSDSPVYHHVTDLSQPCRAALGFLRSYAHLIRHRSDFALAQQAQLIPPFIEFSAFATFIRPFRVLSDSAVSRRYHYGQLQLTRLNFAVRIFRPAATGSRWPWYYRRKNWQVGQYIERLTAPALFIFAAFALVLTAMQVLLQVRTTREWRLTEQISLGFAAAVITLASCIGIGAFFGVLGVLVIQDHFSLKSLCRRT